VQLAGVEPQLEPLALAGPAGRAEPGHDLVGATRGVVGAGVGGQLLELLRRRPRAPEPEVGVLVGPQRLRHVHHRREREALGPHLGRQGDVAEGGAQVAVLQGAGQEVHRRRADGAGHEQVARPLVQLLRGADLLDDAGAHDRDPVAEGHGLGLVVGDVDGGGAELVLEPGHGRPHLHPQLGVQVGERLVHEEGLGAADDGPAHGHALALAAGAVSRAALTASRAARRGGGARATSTRRRHARGPGIR
jgi:hypothetical protein